MSAIETLLVANRGEIACRIMRTARQLGIRTVAVYSPADRDALHVRTADVAIGLATGYLDGEAVLDAARDAGADAIHPGYGFLSENATFARSVIDAGFIWVGPGPEAIAAMGDKLAAKRLAVEVGIPTLPMAHDAGQADEVGYPLLVKASAGGGGKGMRVVERPDDLAEAVAAARREALAGFGDDTVFFERYVTRSRHVEIQVLGDQHGEVIHLGERECSIQRRHQKVIEEAPSPVVDDEMRAAMGAAAVALAKRLSYTSAGTVEFLVDDVPGPDGRRAFWFLEVNTRLQVEHPVTEFVTGLDLVAEQLRLAAGEPLGYGQSDVRLDGHAIEVRLYAEDPSSGFLPSVGVLHAFEPASSPAVRWDSGVVTGSEVTANFDPMLAKVIAHAPTRVEAARRLALALERSSVVGVLTNRDLLVSTLRHRAYLAGDTTTDFFAVHEPALVRPIDADEAHRLAVAGALWLQARARRTAIVLGFTPSGWRNGRLPDERRGFVIGGHDMAVSYRARRDGSFLIDGERSARVIDATEGHVDVEVGHRRVRGRVTHAGDRLWINDGAGDVELRIAPRFVVPGAIAPAGSLDAPMPGRVLDVRVAVGDVITAGQLLVILEAMKMEHRVTAPSDGVVTVVKVAIGDQVALGANLLVVEVSA